MPHENHNKRAGWRLGLYLFYYCLIMAIYYKKYAIKINMKKIDFIYNRLLTK